MKKVAVVGTVVDDRIVSAQGRSTRSLGGIVYSVGAMAALAPAVEIWPVTRVGRDVSQRLSELWAGMPMIRHEAIVPFDGPNTAVELDYRVQPSGGADRSEVLRYPMAPLGLQELEAARGADAVLVNCITGFDLSLEALEHLCALNPHVYLDVHSLTLALHTDGTRASRAPANLDRWLSPIEYLQCNEHEIEVIAGGLGGGVDDAIATILATGTRAVLVTRRGRGVSVYRSHRDWCLPIDAPPVQTLDPTGAGDTFGAAFIAALVQGRSIPASARRATLAASASCLLSGVGDLARLPELAERLGRQGRDA